MQSMAMKILSRIHGRGRGWAFSSKDFSSEFTREQIDNALSDLTKKGKIRRVCRGIYDYPKYSILLDQELSPDFDQIAQAIARKFNWRIQPSGDAALNLLGLSTQVPGRIIYLSDGPTRKYSIGGYTLEFKKCALKYVGFKHKESGLIVQALKALGEKQVEKIKLEDIRKNLDISKGKKITKDTRLVTSWVYDYIKRIYSENM
ncbi:hypothetical protein VU12_14090 [Desulfobulbus sp. US4]|nr:hypothetical protein [Desulfobulbus sp. US4]